MARLNPLDRLISAFSPSWGLKRAQARSILAYYEAARPDRQRKQRRETRTGSEAVRSASIAIRDQARHLEQNHDIARAILRALVNNTVGAAGIGVEPTPLTRTGEVHEDLAAQLLQLWERWGERPEVTRQLTWPAVQRLFARTLYRDGECLQRFVTGAIQHASALPLSIELMEPDFLPLGQDAPVTGTNRRILDGIEYNAWGTPIAYHLHREHPRERTSFALTDLKRVPAQDIIHGALRDRLHQRRGMSLFAAIINRLDDLKDYEESEALAAKIAAHMGAAITKGTPEFYQPSEGATAPRELNLPAGVIYDGLMPGEKVEMIGNNNRPNPQLVLFRNSFLRAATSGAGVGYPNVSRDYDGSYSAQRQGLIDAFIDYAVMSQDLAATLVRPTYRRVVQTAIGTGLLTLPQDIDLASVDQAMYVIPQMPWIDPAKEQSAWEGLERAGHASGPEIIRKRGRSPSDVLREETLWRQRWRQAGETLSTDPASDATAAPEPLTLEEAA